MRVAPIALLCPREEVHDLAMVTSALTHGHPTAQIAAAAWAGMLADVGTGMGLEEAAEAALERLKGDDAAETRGAIRVALDASRDGEPTTVETLGGGWTAEEALSIALYACLASDGVEFGLRCAATHSGDSDSTAAVAGNMMGLLHPEELLRHRWARRVQFREWFGKMSREWTDAAGGE
jgi:ADP-ribosylglycohydrolase